MGMWKEAYAVGNELIDSQHKELFRMADEFMDTMRRKGPDSQMACARAVGFLKSYVVKHFADEEALQASLNYKGLAEHKILHKDFVATVLQYEKELIKGNFDQKIMQQFAGTLIGWLVYHVVGEDGKITGAAAAAPPLSQVMTQPGQFVACFADSACEVLGQMLNIPVKPAPYAPALVSQAGDISVSIGLVGDCPGEVDFVFPLVTALCIVQHITMMNPAELGDMMDSALREISNIISGNAASKISKTGCACDITTPKLYRGQYPLFKDNRVVKCDLGPLMVAFGLKQ
ncbi:MAG: bacteriohemerythrin [Acidaminococcales bacterium]|jgi:hemerythrin|nr:bacteriohemerythrin [Acidaminococcales bacterium]